MRDFLNSYIQHIDLINAIQNDKTIQHQINECIDLTIETLHSGRRVFFCGNGGSAADAAHLSAELSGQFNIQRPALKSDILHSNVASITAISNDLGYDNLFTRKLQSKANKGDLLFVLSTSGQSNNITSVSKTARELGINTIVITGNKGKGEFDSSNIHIIIPSIVTARIQEATMLIGHIICEKVEMIMFG